MAVPKIALILLITAMVLLELRDPQFRQGWRRDPVRRARNLWFLTAGLLAMLVLEPMGQRLQLNSSAARIWEALPGLEFLACTVLAELVGWTLHYVKHRNAYLWNFHFQHHRESHYNLWLSVHTHALEVLVSGALMAGTLSLLGFSIPAVSAYLLLYSFAKVYQHSAHRYSLGALDWFLIGPNYHRFHHLKHCHCKYGTVLTLWDVVFRTARWPTGLETHEENDYGVEESARLPFGFWPEMTRFLGRRP